MCEMKSSTFRNFLLFNKLTKAIFWYFEPKARNTKILTRVLTVLLHFKWEYKQSNNPHTLDDLLYSVTVLWVIYNCVVDFIWYLVYCIMLYYIMLPSQPSDDRVLHDCLLVAYIEATLCNTTLCNTRDNI